MVARLASSANRPSHRTAARSKRSRSPSRRTRHTRSASSRLIRGSSLAAAMTSVSLPVASARRNRLYGLPSLVTNICSPIGRTEPDETGPAAGGYRLETARGPPDSPPATGVAVDWL